MVVRGTGLSAAIVAGGLFAVDVYSTWIGPPNGIWNASVYWSPAGVPANYPLKSFYVTIDGPPGAAATPYIQSFSPTISSLTIGPEDVLTMKNGCQLSLDGPTLYANDGTLAGASGATGVHFRFKTQSLVLGGAGLLRLQGVDQEVAYFFSENANAQLVNGPSHVVAGVGSLGSGRSQIRNEGVISADTAGGTMVVSAAGSQSGEFAFHNLGLMEATAGGLLKTAGGGAFHSLRNEGEVVARDGSVVELGGVHGGLVRTEGTGLLRLGELLRDVTIDGSAEVHWGCVLKGTIENLGTIEKVVPSAIMHVMGSATLSGSGELILNGEHGLVSFNDPAVLVQTPGHSIRGSGILGSHQMTILNGGLVEATGPGPMTLRCDSGTYSENTGVLRAAGATLRMDGGRILAGQIEATDGGTFSIEGYFQPFLMDPVFAGDGTIEIDTPSATLIRPQLHASMVMKPKSWLHVDESILNEGGITVEQVEGWPTGFAGMGQPFRLSGSSTLRLTGPLATVGPSQNNHWIDNEAGHTICGGGKATMTLGVNHGWMVGDDETTPLTIFSNPAFGYANRGVIRAAAGAGVELTEAWIDNAGGIIEAIGGSSVVLRQNAISGGVVRTDADGWVRLEDGASVIEGSAVDGNFEVSSGLSLILDDVAMMSGTWVVDGVLAMGDEEDNLLLVDGLLRGSGQVQGDVTVEVGTVDAGPLGAALTIAGTLDLREGATLLAAFAAAGPGTLQVVGSCDLSGALRLVVPALVPAGSWQVLEAAMVAGDFQLVELVGPCRAFSVEVTPAAVIVNLGEVLIGDIDCNGLVGGGDLGDLLAAWGTTDAAIDLDGDGIVDQDDLDLLLEAWGEAMSEAPPTPARPVPPSAPAEPGVE